MGSCQDKKPLLPEEPTLEKDVEAKVDCLKAEIVDDELPEDLLQAGAFSSVLPRNRIAALLRIP